VSGDSRTTTPGLVFEEDLLLGSAITLQLQPPLGRKFTLAKRLGLGDVGQKLLLECVRHSLEPRQFQTRSIATRHGTQLSVSFPSGVARNHRACAMVMSAP
jgi:hypothetical protein